jgi:3',5'-cyclic AMP phosphodiesterase CpdA
MRRVAHISDLHFGREDTAVVQALATDLRLNRADLVVVSGDLTQRATLPQFVAARAFLDGLGIPWRSVPGNHDIPLYDVARRMLDPYGRYRKIVAGDLGPAWQDEELAVVGLNTVLPRVWKGGRVRSPDFGRLRDWSEAAGPRARIVFAHHPFAHPAASRGDLVRRHGKALLAMEEHGVDLLLTGHTHIVGHSETREYVVDGPHRIIVVRAGTATSHRRRGEPNSYNLIHVRADRFAIEARRCEDAGFVSAGTHEYARIARRPQSVTTEASGPSFRS